MKKIHARRKLRAEPLESRQLLHGGGFGCGLGGDVDEAFARLDTNEDSVITAEDDVSERMMERLAEAETDGEEGITLDELTAYVEAKQAARIDAIFARLDSDQSGSVTADDVSERRWERIALADSEENGGNGDGAVSREEFENYLDVKRAEREANAEEASTRSMRRGFRRGRLGR